jgi:hypothetical protein
MTISSAGAKSAQLSELPVSDERRSADPTLGYLASSESLLVSAGVLAGNDGNWQVVGRSEGERHTP